MIAPLTLLQMEKSEPEERLDKMKEVIEKVKDKSTESIEELGSIEVCTYLVCFL